MSSTDEYIKKIISGNVISLTFSNKRLKEQKWKKITVRLIKLKEDIYYQFSFFDGKNEIHKNVLNNKLHNEILHILENDFRQINGICENSSFQLKVSKKGKVLFSSKKCENKNSFNLEHNRIKSYLLKTGEVIPPLVDIGVMDQYGNIIKGQNSKFVQINNFLEQIDILIKEYNKKDITIIDFGCGKSYLTFIIYYFLKYIKQIEPNIIGLDLKSEVIDNCNTIAKKYGYDNLIFMNKDIKEYTNDNVVDMVVSLHACNTATDYALYNAIKWNSKYILSVPCCQSEVNSQLNYDGKNSIFKYGIMKERYASLVTDVIRADILKCFGYKVDVIEFIDFDNSPKNLMIRGRLSKKPDKVILNDVKIMLDDLKINQTLYELVKGEF